MLPAAGGARGQGGGLSLELRKRLLHLRLLRLWRQAERLRLRQIAELGLLCRPRRKRQVLEVRSNVGVVLSDDLPSRRLVLVVA